MSGINPDRQGELTLEDFWRAEIGQIILRFCTKKPKGALGVWQSLVSQLPTLLDQRQDSKAVLLWLILLNAIPDLLKTGYFPETHAMWKSLTETVVELRAGRHRERSIVMWKMMLEKAPKLLGGCPAELAEHMWTVVGQTAAKMELDDAFSLQPAPPPTSPKSPPPGSLSSTPPPRPQTLPQPPPSPPAPAPSSPRTSLPSTPSPTQPTPTAAPRSRFDPKRTPLPPPPQLQPSPPVSPSQLLPPEPPPTQKPHSTPSVLPPAEETPDSKPPKPKLKPKPQLVKFQEAEDIIPASPPPRPPSKPTVRQKPVLVIPTPQTRSAPTEASGWRQDMQQVIGELGSRGVGTPRKPPRTGRLPVPRPKSWAPAGTPVGGAARMETVSESSPDPQDPDPEHQGDQAAETEDTSEEESDWEVVPRARPRTQTVPADETGTGRLRASASFTYAPPSDADAPMAASNTLPRLALRTAPKPPGAAVSPRRASEPAPRPVVTSAARPASTAPSPPAEQLLWCKLPVVVKSGILEGLSSDQRKLQEALFEVISTEVSYHSSLLTMQQHYQEPLLDLSRTQSSGEQNAQNSLQNAFTEEEYQDLFHNADEVRKCSEAFLADLNDVKLDVLSGLCDAVREHATWHFYPYKLYCAQKVHQDHQLQQLTDQNAAFAALLTRLEASQEVRGRSLATFLHLPVQRVQRLPLLMTAVLKRMPADHQEREACDEALQALTKLAVHCDEDAAREIQRLEAQRNGASDPDRINKGRLSWRRRGVRRASPDAGSQKRST